VFSSNKTHLPTRGYFIFKAKPPLLSRPPVSPKIERGADRERERKRERGGEKLFAYIRKTFQT